MSGRFRQIVREAIAELDASGYPGGFSTEDNPTYDAVVDRICAARHTASDAETLDAIVAFRADADKIERLATQYDEHKPDDAVELRKRVRFMRRMADLAEQHLAENAPTGHVSDAESLARDFHETYERLAPVFGYETRRESAKPWEDVPEKNRGLMAAVCAELIARKRVLLPSVTPPTPWPGASPNKRNDEPVRMPAGSVHGEGRRGTQPDGSDVGPGESGTPATPSTVPPAAPVVPPGVTPHWCELDENRVCVHCGRQWSEQRTNATTTPAAETRDADHYDK